MDTATRLAKLRTGYLGGGTMGGIHLMFLEESSCLLLKHFLGVLCPCLPFTACVLQRAMGASVAVGIKLSTWLVEST